MVWDEVLLAPAKVNLHLAVGRRRCDGYHDITSLFCRVSLSDELRFSCQRQEEPRVVVSGLGDICPQATDTMTKAACAWMKESGIPLAVQVDCTKHIPTKAGLGGGSSDAASVLLALERRYPIGKDRLLSVAASVGSDVPFFLSETGCAYVSGRGERVRPLPARRLYGTFVMPEGVFFATQDAYRALDGIVRPPAPSENAVIKAFLAGTAAYRGVFRNDFLLVAERYPVYGELSRLSNDFNGYGSLSGSGACWFFVSEERTEALRFQMSVRNHLSCGWTCMAEVVGDQGGTFC